MTRIDALMLLLAMPDPPEMRRAYRYTCPRDPLIDPDIIKRNLGTAYVTHRRQDRGADISCVVSVRRISAQKQNPLHHPHRPSNIWYHGPMSLLVKRRKA